MYDSLFVIYILPFRHELSTIKVSSYLINLIRIFKLLISIIHIMVHTTLLYNIINK